ncbi:MAG: hypothetical protein AB7I38_05460 [Dehalococcoidia bacterium]
MTTFQAMGIRERSDLQATIRDCPEILGEDLLIISEEFGDWETVAGESTCSRSTRAANWS